MQDRMKKLDSRIKASMERLSHLRLKKISLVANMMKEPEVRHTLESCSHEIFCPDKVLR